MSPAPIETAVTGHVRTDDIPFATLTRPWGTTRMQLISVSLATNTFVNVIDRRDPAATASPYGHGPRLHHVRKWRYLEYDWVAEPNSYVHQPPGTTHTLRVEADMKALFVTQGAFIYLDDNGELIGYSDAGVMLQEVRQALASEGLELPEAILH